MAGVSWHQARMAILYLVAVSLFLLTPALREWEPRVLRPAGFSCQIYQFLTVHPSFGKKIKLIEGSQMQPCSKLRHVLLTHARLVTLGNQPRLNDLNPETVFLIPTLPAGPHLQHPAHHT